MKVRFWGARGSIAVSGEQYRAAGGNTSCVEVEHDGHDAQYHWAEYAGQAGPPRKGWGHSSWLEAVCAAQRAGARRLALFHHDPARDDEGVANIETLARERFAEAFAAREGEVVTL